MTDKRLDQLSETIYQNVFHLLDGEPEFSGDEAIRIASKMEGFFRELTHADHLCVECGNPIDSAGLCPDCEWALDGRRDDGQPTEMDEWASFDPDC